MALTVSQLAAKAGVSPHTVRYYEQVGLLATAERSAAGYRLHDEEAVARLRFVKGARRLGLRIEDVRQLLAVGDCGLCLCGQAEAVVRQRLVEVEARLEHLAALRDALAALLERYPAEACPDEQARAWPCLVEFMRAGGVLVREHPCPPTPDCPCPPDEFGE
jgi:DNA-binding transcriptional MerR regulator